MEFEIVARAALAAVAGGWAGYLVLQFFRGDYGA